MSSNYSTEQFDNDSFISMVNAHHDKLKNLERERMQESSTEFIYHDFDTPERRSISHERISYGRKKVNNKKKIHSAIQVIVLSVAFLSGAIAANGVINTTNAVLPITWQTREDVNDRIDYYEKLMGMNSEYPQYRLETCYSHDANGQAIVDYSPSNLVDRIIKASEISESEVRCVIIAAYNIINEPYREDVLDTTFFLLSQRIQNDDSILLDDYLITGNAQGFLRQLGYEDWDEYKMNERKNIKTIKAIEDYKRENLGNNGRRI